MNQSRIARPANASRSGRAQRSQAAVVSRYIQELSAGKRQKRERWIGCGPAQAAPAGTGRVTS